MFFILLCVFMLWLFYNNQNYPSTGVLSFYLLQCRSVVLSIPPIWGLFCLFVFHCGNNHAFIMSANIYFIHCSDFTEELVFLCVTFFILRVCDIHIKTCVQIHIYYIHNFGTLLTVLFYNQTTIIMDSIIRLSLIHI